MENFTSSKEHFLQTQLEAVSAENVRLTQENDLLRAKLKKISAEEHTSNVIHVEAKLKAFKLEEECDRMYENLEKIKRKYNKLHEAYLEKVKRCKALEDVFHRQKTLNGLVMKSAMENQQKGRSDVNEIATEGPYSKKAGERSSEDAGTQLEKLKTALSEAYDIIDELEFELESVDFLEVENQRLQYELNTYKKEKYSRRPGGKQTADESSETGTEYKQNDKILSNYETVSNASSSADSLVGDLDSGIIERSALTESLVKMAESESNCLRRELLRSRLKQVPRQAVRPISSEV